MPKPYIADCDLNLAGALRWLKTAGKLLPVGYDVIDRDEAGKPIDEGMRYTRLMKCLSDAANSPEVETIVVDSATKLSDYIMSDVLREQGKRQMEMTSWGFYLRKWTSFIGQLTAIPKNFVLICHEKVEKDEVDQALRYFINLPGQIKDIIGSMFTDVWRTEVSEKPGIKPEYDWMVRTMPNFRFALKNSLGLPPLFKFDWPTIAAKLSS